MDGSTPWSSGSTPGSATGFAPGSSCVDLEDPGADPEDLSVLISYMIMILDIQGYFRSRSSTHYQLMAARVEHQHFACPFVLSHARATRMRVPRPAGINLRVSQRHPSGILCRSGSSEDRASSRDAYQRNSQNDFRAADPSGPMSGQRSATERQWTAAQPRRDMPGDNRRKSRYNDFSDRDGDSEHEAEWSRQFRRWENTPVDPMSEEETDVSALL
eukprot:2280080-Pyramimonas_sp.AAC.1